MTAAVTSSSIQPLKMQSQMQFWQMPEFEIEITK